MDVTFFLEFYYFLEDEVCIKKIFKKELIKIVKVFFLTYL